ncbi:metal ABC transporter solute-binding protein, Zn/Mn family [Campylobacter portucalensis]
MCLCGALYAKPLVTTTILPTKYFVEQISGDTLDVVALVEKGADPHTYEPKPSQMKSVEKSQLHFEVGMEFDEMWLPRLQKQFPNLEIVQTQNGIEKIAMAPHHHSHDHHHGQCPHHHDEDHMHNDGVEAMNDDNDHDHKECSHHHDHGHHHHHGDMAHHTHDMAHHMHNHHHGQCPHHHGHHHSGLDPHIWTDPILVKIQAKNIKDALVKKFPTNKEKYEKNYAKFIKVLDDFDQQTSKKLSNLKNNKFIVYHPSWGYFAKRYNLVQIPIEVEGKEPKPADLKELIEEAKEEDIKVIFVAPQFSKKSAKIIAKESGAKVVEIDQLPENWLKEMKKTVDIFAKALNK